MPSGGRDIGYYALPIVPSFEGGIRKMSGDLDKVFGNVSKSASKALGEGIADGVQAAEAAVKRSSTNIAKLRDKEAAAADKLRVAEERIAEVRDKGGSTLARAEAQRNAALRQQEAALRDITAETRTLESAQRRLASAQTDAARGPSDAGGWIDKLQSKAEGALSSLEGLGSGGAAAGSQFVEGFSGAVASLGTKAGPIGLAIAAAAGVALAGGKIIADQVFAGMDQQQSRANVQAKLGVDDATMKRIADAAAQSYVGNFGESVEANMDVARTAIQDGLLDPGASTGAQSAMISQLTTVSDILGEDIPNVARAAEQAIRTGLAPNATAAFDLIVKGQQAGLNASEDWLDTLNEYGTQFRKLGLDGTQATGLLSQMVKGGARDTDVAADALKEFSIRVVDGSKTTADAFTSIGLNADDMQRKFLAGGDTARTAFQQTVTAINSIQDPVARNSVLLGLFGTQYEDLGNAINNVDLTTAVNQLGQVEGATKRAADTAGGTAASSWESMRRTVETAVDGMQQQLAGVFGPAVAGLADEVTSHQAEIIQFFTAIGSAAIEFGQAGLDFAGDFTGALAGVVNAVGDVYGAILRTGVALKRLTGDNETADRWDAEATAAFGWADSLYRTSDALKDAAAKGDDWQAKLEEQGRKAQDVAEVNKALGDSLESLKVVGNDVTIDIKDNTPELRARLDAEQMHLEQMANDPTRLRLVADTTEADNRMNSFRESQGASPVVVKPEVDPAAAQKVADFFNQYRNMPVGVNPNIPSVTPPGPNAPTGGNPFAGPYPRAMGGIDGSWQKMPGDAHIGGPVYPNGLVRYREPSTKGEAYIPLNGTRRSVDIWAETGRRLGVWAFDTGGFYPDVNAAESLAGTPYSQGSRTDCSGMVARVINRALGLPDSGLMSTKNARQWLTERGFRPGAGGPGSITVGWYDHGPNPNDGHMAMTLSNGQNAEAGGSNGVFTIGSGASGANDPKFDQQMFLPVWSGEGAGADGSLGGGFGSAAGGGGGRYAPAGVNPETGESGYYTPDAKQVREAEQKVSDADARVKEAEARQRELEADAKESEKISAQAEVDKAKREAADARADLAEAKRGKFTALKGADFGSGGGGGGGDLSPLGGIFGSFLKETLGLDGSLFPDISNLMPVQMLGAALDAFKGPIQGALAGQLGIQQPGWQPGMPVGGQSASGLPFGMIPSPFDFAGNATPNMAPPGTPASGIGAGAPPGPVDQSRNVAISVDSGPNAAEIGNVVRREVNNVDRLHTYVPKGN